MRDFYIIAVICVVAIIIGTVLFFFGPASLQADVSSALRSGPKVVPFTVLAQGNRALAVTDPTNYRITSTAELDALWPLIYGSESDSAIPDIDFTKYEILAVFDGSHPTTGYGVSVLEVTEENNVRTVTINDAVPSSHCSWAYTSTSPFELIQVSATSLSLTHIDLTSTTSCP